MTSTASTTSSTPSPSPASGTSTSEEHDPGDATVTEQPGAPAGRAAAKASQAESAAPTAPEPVAATGAERAAPAEPTQRTARVRRSPDLRAGAKRAATLTKSGVNRVRTLLGEIAWIVCLLAAAALLLGTAVVVLEANTHNALVEGVLKAADVADLGVFSRTGGVKQFTGENAVIKNAFVNWGLGAVAWLVVGRIARRVLTP
ncbi:hypothetical protein [Terrabacter sp. 2RAF25]|uniref:hypothetical protein n=1 Tax=Terrabacter sp. 2RAF25 TaxID=3232998 RepID=UPI003F9A30F4